MNYSLFSRIFKYIDCFGIKFNFYIDRKRKLYTPLGGILTLFSLIFGIFLFLLMNKDELRHKVPLSSTSVIQEDIRNIKFIQEKIWIPWRIRDYEGNIVDFKEILYPIIYYYKGVKNKTDDKFNLEYTLLNYRLCNETLMNNNTDLFIIDTPLDQLYCIDMDDLNIGGNWNYDFINYVEFDLYICKNGEDYDENNINCTSYPTSLEFDIYYPLVHYQPTNKTNPIFIKYYSYFYLMSKYSNKIDRIYLQKHVLINDDGWVSKNEHISSFWGCETFNGDSYATGTNRDLMSEGSTSRLYSFNIYLNFEAVIYHRYYKNIFLLIIEGLPLIYIIFTFFKFISKILKISVGNKKLTESLFENLREKTSRIRKTQFGELYLRRRSSLLNYNNDKLNLNKITSNNDNSNKDESNNNNKSNNNITVINIHNNEINNSSILLNQQDQIKNLSKKNKNKDVKKVTEIKKSYSPQKKSFLRNSHFNNRNNNHINPQKNNNNNRLNFHMMDFIKKQSSDLISEKDNSLKKKDSHRHSLNKESYTITPSSIKQYEKKRLFPFKYYLFSIFIKNMGLKQKSCCFTRKFIVVYNFICLLFDISSYLVLQKEFQIMKNTMAEGKYKDILETNKKINVNSSNFNIDMKECLDNNKFSILGRIKESPDDI